MNADALVGGCVVWLTGLPSSGKSTLAARLADELRARHRPCCVLDGDAIRAALVPSPGYSAEERARFYATLARLAALLAAQGLVVLVPATANQRSYRRAARSLALNFVEVYVATDAAECAKRDAKGLYAAARAGRTNDVPGVDVDYEAPANPEIVAAGGLDENAIRSLLVRLDALA